MREIRKLFDLTGRVAVITGAAGHIGGAIADALAELGAAIVIIDMDETRTRCAADTIAAARGVRTFPLALDLEDEAAVRSAPTRVVAQLGRLDILVNCAALVGTSGLEGWAVPIRDQSVKSWRRAIEVNLTAPFILIQAAAGPLYESGNGSIINILSIYGLVGPDERLYEGTPLGNPAAYGVSKSGLLQLTRHVATTLAPNVRCNAITPGGVERGQPDAFKQRYKSRTPLRRLAAEEDLKGAAAFLASDASAYVSGQNIVVDGGWTAW